MKRCVKLRMLWVIQLPLWICLPIQMVWAQPSAMKGIVQRDPADLLVSWNVIARPGWFKKTSEISFGGFRVSVCDPGKKDVSRKMYHVSDGRMVQKIETREGTFRLERC